MASELSRFIEDELKKQGIHDDEEQKLLAGLRVKPLSVQGAGTTGAPSAASRWQLKHMLLAAAGVGALLLGLILLVMAVRGPTAKPITGALIDPDAGGEMMVGKPPGPAQGQGDAAAGGTPATPQEVQPPPPDEPAPPEGGSDGEVDDYIDPKLEEEAQRIAATMPPDVHVHAPPQPPAEPVPGESAAPAPTTPAAPTPAEPTPAATTSAEPTPEAAGGTNTNTTATAPIDLEPGVSPSAPAAQPPAEPASGDAPDAGTPATVPVEGGDVPEPATGSGGSDTPADAAAVPAAGGGRRLLRSSLPGRW